MEDILEKLDKITDNAQWSNWSIADKKKLLELYFLLSTKESHIFALIYQYHGCDSWEDIFRDGDATYLKDKARGVAVAIKEIAARMKEDRT